MISLVTMRMAHAQIQAVIDLAVARALSYDDAPWLSPLCAAHFQLGEKIKLAEMAEKRDMAGQP